MGGYGSGGWNHKGRPTLESCLRIRIADLKRHGVLKHGAEGIWSWGESAVGYETRWDDMIVLTWRQKDEETEHEQFLGFQWLAHPRNFGGYQHYFVCPRCHRRCAAVYFLREFACRKCHRLPYRSQRLGPMDRLYFRKEKLGSTLHQRRGRRKAGAIARYEALDEQHEELLARGVAKILVRTS